MNQLKALATAGIDVDTPWVLSFAKKVHARGGRPCTMPGKVMMSQHFCPENVWFKTGLVQVGRTEEVPMMAARDMINIEDVGEAALPSMTEDGLSTRRPKP